MEKYRNLKYPPVVFWEVTDRCNHNCIHCFNYWRTDKEAISHQCERTEEYYLRVANKILEQKPVRVIFTGGEPLLQFNQLKPTLELFHRNHINISFNTNAALLTDEIAEFFSENRIGMFISFPSCKKEEFDKIVDFNGAFEKVMSALEIAKRHYLYFSFNMVISTVNLNSIYDTAKFLKSNFNINNFSVTRVSTPINAIDRFDQYFLSKEQFDTYMNECVRVRRDLNIKISAASPLTPCSITSQDAFELFAFEGGCEAGKTSYVIGSNGKVRACARDCEEYGDFMNDEFDAIWANMSDWRDSSFIPSECNECEHKSRCRGGCRVDGIIKNNKKSCLDNYSDIDRLPITFTKSEKYLPVWDYSTTFAVPKSIQRVDEEGFVRLSYRSGYVYCTPKFSEYLLNIDKFSISDFSKEFDQSLDDSRNILNHLFENGIIYII